MNDLLSWLPWIGVALLPGVFNTLVAYRELSEKCKILAFFEPQKSFGFWLWLVAELLMPCLPFWFAFSLSSKPTIDIYLIIEAVLFGFGFVALLNSRTKVGSLRTDIKPFYDYIVNIAYDLIAASQTRKAAEFWTDVEDELNASSDLNDGLDFLENYFVISDVSLTRERKESYQQQLDMIDNISSRTEQVKMIIATVLKDVRRRDLPEVLRRMGCRRSFLQKYYAAALPNIADGNSNPMTSAEEP
ncbi:hypothetical protein [Leptolyngbya sp. FACHB-261]|uniref:hypothetical protein n=1 Tax=Leptolyngbya sp. FACHB-261 TaxID=2692806 RepID=UPI00168886DC|nr:hypothetical protein [Leptolyngbya sp. FACHB-261]MBD2102232.1 hypothetical protein [Leptolyngbya sp. FACHB-261]